MTGREILAMTDDPTQQQERTTGDEPSDPEQDIDSSDESIALIDEQTEEAELVFELIQAQHELLQQEAARTQEEHQAFLHQEDTETVSNPPLDTLTTPVDTSIMSRWLGTARTDHEAQGMAVAVKKEDRSQLSADALIKLQKTVTEGMTHKFSLMSHHSDDQLVDCYNLALRIDTLKNRLKETDTIGGFDIFETPVTQPTTTMPRELRLIDKIDALSETLVRAAMKFKRYYGQTYDIQDLQWSQEMVKNSCDEDLATKVMERLRRIPDEEKGGALFYYIMIKLIQTDTEQAVRVLTEKLEKLSLKTLAGENVFTACSLIRGVIERLEIVGKVPHDVDTTVMRILQTSSVDKFNSTFSTLEQSRFLGVMVATTVEQMLILAEKLYTSIISDEGWTGFGRVGKSTFTMSDDRTVTIGNSTFVIGDDGEIKKALPPRADGPVCWKCGKAGHLAWQCPNKQGGGGGGGGRGAGGGGRGTGRGDGKGSIKRIPPKPGDSHERTVNGINMYWCGTCASWNSTHLTADHVERQPAAANIAEQETAEDPGTGAVADTDDTADRVTFYSNVTKRMTGVGK
jgi:hypothetical protein